MSSALDLPPTTGPSSAAVAGEISEADKKAAPWCDRNQGPILEVLSTRLPAPTASTSSAAGGGPLAMGVPSLAVLEVGSGNGQHAAFFAAGLPAVATWQPTDYNDESFRSVAAFAKECPKVLAPRVLDAAAGVGGASAWGMHPVSVDVVFNGTWGELLAALLNAARSSDRGV